MADQTLELRSRFQDVVSHEFELRRIIGKPSFWFQSKMLTHLTSGCRDFIAASPFMIIASAGAAGAIDASPRGDPAGFVFVLDDATLAIPDRPGNRRCDTLQNILDRPRVGLIFFVPGKAETLRISGHAVIVRDRALRESLALDGRLPDLAVVVGIERAFFTVRDLFVAPSCGKPVACLDSVSRPWLPTANRTPNAVHSRRCSPVERR